MYERKDAFYRKAKREGYRSRAAYKLLSLNRDFHLLKRGDRVVDLGSWPGGWVQVAAEVVGKEGKVVGIDLAPLDPLPLQNTTLLQGDATDPAQQEQIRAALDGKANVVLSDMAPKLSGIKEADQVRALTLYQAALSCALALLRPNGTLLVKVFAGSEQKAFLSQLRSVFATVKTTRSEAARKGSAETYVLAAGKKS
jgi:23S rRNA (uridine2552-2'-O)-methyltransferase